MKSLETFHRTAAVLALCFALSAMNLVGEEDGTNFHTFWRGFLAVQDSTDKLLATVAVITIDGEVTMLGSISNEDGFHLTFIDSSLDRPMVSAMKGPVEGLGLLELWSDGTCDHLELFSKSRRVPLTSSAARLLESLPKNTTAVLAGLRTFPNLRRVVDALEDVLEEDIERNVPTYSARSVKTMPEQLAEAETKILSRYGTSRAILLAIGKVGASRSLSIGTE